MNSAEQFNAMVDRLLKKSRNFYDHVLSPSQWTQTHRVLTSDLGAARPGRWSHDETPYLKEIMDNFAPDSGVVSQTIMKATRMGFTTAAVNVAGWVMDQFPTTMRILIPNADTLKNVMVVQLGNMIQSSGIEKKIVDTHNIKSKRRTGSTTLEKFFVGGHIVGTSLNSKSALVSYSAQIVVVDEFDEVFQGKDADDKATRIFDRASTFGLRARVCYMSMPATKNTSQVYKLFLEGDQRYFFVPCPHCGFYQRLQWQDEEGNFGFVYDVDAQGQVIKESVAMVCSHSQCGKKIYEKDKYAMLQAGQWRPTAGIANASKRSYQISALYSNFRSWHYIAQQWVEAQGDLQRLQSFVKSILGQPWEDRQSSHLWRTLRTLNRADDVSHNLYHSWSAQQLASIRFISMGVDVQHDYLEVQIVGWANYTTAFDLHHFQIEGKSQEGQPSLLSTAFTELARRIVTGDWDSPYLGHGSLSHHFTHLSLAKKMVAPDVILVDSGHQPALVHQFCAQFASGVYASRGQNTLKGDQVILPKFNTQAGATTITMNTDLLKLELINAVLNSSHTSVQMNILHHRDDKYFKSLLSEQRVERNGKFYWEKVQGGHRNEVLDCWVMARAGLWFIATQFFDGQPIHWSQLFS